MRVVAILALFALCPEVVSLAVGSNDHHEALGHTGRHEVSYSKSNGTRVASVAQSKSNGTRVQSVPVRPLQGSMLQVMDGIKAEFDLETTSWDQAAAKVQAEEDDLRAAEQEHEKLVEEGKTQNVQLNQQMAELQSKAQLIQDSQRTLDFEKGNVTSMNKDLAELQAQKYKLALLVQKAEDQDAGEDVEVQKAEAANRRAISAVSAKLGPELRAARAKEEASKALLWELKKEVAHKEEVLALATTKASEAQHLASVDITLMKSGRSLLTRASEDINQTMAAEDEAKARARSAQQQLRDIATKAVKLKQMESIVSAPVDNGMDATASQLDTAW